MVVGNLSASLKVVRLSRAIVLTTGANVTPLTIREKRV